MAASAKNTSQYDKCPFEGRSRDSETIGVLFLIWWSARRFGHTHPCGGPRPLARALKGLGGSEGPRSPCWALARAQGGGIGRTPLPGGGRGGRSPADTRSQTRERPHAPTGGAARTPAPAAATSAPSCGHEAWKKNSSLAMCHVFVTSGVHRSWNWTRIAPCESARRCASFRRAPAFSGAIFEGFLEGKGEGGMKLKARNDHS